MSDIKDEGLPPLGLAKDMMYGLTADEIERYRSDAYAAGVAAEQARGGMSTRTQERETFDAVIAQYTNPARLDEALERDEGGSYDRWQTALSWEVWQAARATPPALAEPFAWATHHDEPMLFPTRAEAEAYCADDEEPIPLYTHPKGEA